MTWTITILTQDGQHLLAHVTIKDPGEVVARILQQINQHRRYRVTVPERFRSVAMFIEDAD